MHKIYDQGNYCEPILKDGNRLCGLPDCGRVHKSRGLCSKHYQRLNKRIASGSGTVEVDGRLTELRCYHEGCVRKHYARNMCLWHYRRDPEVMRMRNEWYRNADSPGVARAKQKTHAYKRSLHGRYKVAVEGARRREIQWTITEEEFGTVSNLPCHYCGTSRPADYGGSWLDRVDNEKPYVLSNVVPCCWGCNRLKSELLSAEEMKRVISLLHTLRGFPDVWRNTTIRAGRKYSGHSR